MDQTLDQKHPEIVDKVLSEIKSLKDNTTKNYEGLRNSYEEFKSLMEENSKDYLTTERLEKFQVEILTRQEELDKSAAEMQEKLHERIDNVEVALKRSPKGEEGPNDFEDAKSFHITVKSLNNKGEKGVDFEEVERLQIDVDSFKAYKNALIPWMRKYGGNRDLIMDPEKTKALQVGIDPDGGYTVTPAMSSRIIQRMYETDPLRQLASVETITTDAIEWLVDWDEAGAEWETETVATSDKTTPQLQKKRIPVHFLATRPAITQKLLEDSGINVENWLSDKVADKFSRTEAASFVTGNGVGKPRGFLTYATGTSYGQVEQVNMGAAAALTADGFVSVKYALKEFHLNRGTWLMNRSTVAAAMKLKDANGQYIWKPSMIAGDPASSILELPVRMSTTMPAIAASALSVALADWAEAYMIVDRLGVTVQRDPYTRKPFIEFYFRKRVGGDVVNYDAIKIGKISA